MFVNRMVSTWKSRKNKYEVARMVFALSCSNWAGALFIVDSVDWIFAPLRREKKTEKEQCLPDDGRCIEVGGASKSIVSAMTRRRRSNSPWGCLSTSHSLRMTRHGSHWWYQLHSPYVLLLHLQPCNQDPVLTLNLRRDYP